MGPPRLERCPQRLLDALGLELSRVYQQHQIHQVLDARVVTVLPGKGIGVYLFGELLIHRVERNAHSRNPGKAKKSTPLHPVRLAKHCVAQAYIQVKPDEGPPC
jgi:hypothetical protein